MLLGAIKRAKAMHGHDEIKKTNKIIKKTAKVHRSTIESAQGMAPPTTDAINTLTMQMNNTEAYFDVLDDHKNVYSMPPMPASHANTSSMP